MITKIFLPRLGQTMEEGKIIRWFKSKGDQVKKGEIIFEVETDKTIFQVESEGNGVIKEIFINEGETIRVGATLGYIAEPEEEIPKNLLILRNSINKEKDDYSTLSNTTEFISKYNHSPQDRKFKASPAAKKLAREKGLDLSQITISNYGGVISVRDVENYLKILEKTGGVGYKDNDIVFKEIPGVYEIKKKEVLSYIRQNISTRLTRSLSSALHISMTIEINATHMKRTIDQGKLDLHKKSQAKITYTSILVTQIAKTIREFSIFNARLDGLNILYIKNINIGVAVSIPSGLIVPVIRNADLKSLTDISIELRELIEKARNGKLLPDEYNYGTFTLSNLGMFSIESCTSIINPPEVAILGVGSIMELPRVVNKKITILPVFKATLNSDHRIVDGEMNAKFLNKLKEFCEQRIERS